MTSVMSQAWKVIRPHVPLIRFRKGDSERGTEAVVKNSGSGPIPSAKLSASSIPVIEDWQLPARYRRQSLDQKEIDAINSGGAY